MDKIFIIGDEHSVNAFRVCGIEGFNAGPANSEEILKSLLMNDDAFVILLTRECAENCGEMIRKVNLESVRRIIIEIPGIDDEPGFGRSLTSYITEALGVAL